MHLVAQNGADPAAYELFRALGDPNRIRLLLLLVERCRRCTVGELAKCLTVDPSVVSRHLSLMRSAGILNAEREGQRVHYSIQYDVLTKTLRVFADAIDACRVAAESNQECCRGE